MNTPILLTGSNRGGISNKVTDFHQKRAGSNISINNHLGLCPASQAKFAQAGGEATPSTWSFESCEFSMSKCPQRVRFSSSDGEHTGFHPRALFLQGVGQPPPPACHSWLPGCGRLSWHLRRFWPGNEKASLQAIWWFYTTFSLYRAKGSLNRPKEYAHTSNLSSPMAVETEGTRNKQPS